MSTPDGRVMLATEDPPLAVTAWLTGPATISAGYSTWEVLDRPRRIGLAVWRGMAPYQMTLPLLLDGWITGASVEPEIGRLERMARIVPALGQAPVVRAAGPLPRGAGAAWVISGLEWGEGVIRSSENGHRLRQDLTLTLLQHLSGDVVLERTAAQRARERPAGAGRGASDPVHVVRAGETTLRQVAAKRLGAATRWPEIGRLNQIRDPKAIRVGQVLRVPT